MPLDHQKYVAWNGERFISWAEKVGENTAAVVCFFLGANKIEQQGYKSCMALLKLADRYSIKRLEAACAKTLTYTVRPSLKNVQAILKSGQDKLLDKPELETPPEASQYGFTRGAEYYKRGDN
ncbi:MAG: hypothetical protein DDT21_02557 [Syntrophomonadaceae bacterium]|nr:hypothetical protein [Bacillota bacterium]